MTSCRVSTKHLCFSSDALSHEPAMPRRWASILHLFILYRGSGLELAYIEALMHFIILHCPRLQFKLVAVTCQEYECSLFSKRVNKDSALRNCTSLVIPLVCPHTPPPPISHNLGLISPGYYSRPKGNWRQCVFLDCNHVQGGQVGGQFNRIFSRRMYMKIEFSSQRTEMLLFLTTNMAAVTLRQKRAIQTLPTLPRKTPTQE